MKLNAKQLPLVFIIVSAVLCSYNVSSLLTSSYMVKSSGKIEALNLEVYLDQQGTRVVDSVDWGAIEPGGRVNRLVYVKNSGTSPLTLSTSVSGWTPAGANTYLSFYCDKEGAVINPGEVMPLTLTLDVSKAIAGITNFAFDVTIEGTETSSSPSPSPSPSPYPNMVVKYSTDFEDAVKVDLHHLNLPIEHWFEFAADFTGTGNGNGGARMWVNTNIAHGGTKSLGMELFDITLSRRNEFNILNVQNLAGDEIFVSVWLYLPSTWSLHVPGIDWNWCSLMEIYFDHPNYLPNAELVVYQPDITKPVFDIAVGGRDINNNGFTLNRISNFPLPRGRWFNVQYYLLRHTTNGAIKVWVDGKLICDVTGIQTKAVGSTGYHISPGKIYHHPQETAGHRLYVDDLQIYGKP